MSILTFNLAQKPFIYDMVTKLLLKKYQKSKFIFIDYPDKKKLYLKFKNAEFISHNHFIKAKFKKQNNFFLGIDFYKKNIFSEKIINQILSRYQINHDTFDSYDRNIYIKNILKYYGDFIVNNKIKWVIFYDYPHHIDTYPFYVLAKYLKIKITIISYLYLLGNYRVVIDKNLKDRFINYRKGYNSKIDKKEILKKINQYNNINYHIKPNYITNVNLLSIFFLKDLYRSFKRGFFLESNFYSKLNNKSNFFNEKISIEINSVFVNLFQRVKIKQLQREYLKECSKDNNLNKNYILFMPSVQPEASTLPLAGFFYDFTIILDMLLKNLPKNWLIFYKEHPLTFNFQKESHLFKKLNFYKNINDKRIKFIDHREDTYKYIMKSKCVATATGSAGLEALLKGKPVLNFGKAWWSHFSNIFTIQNDCDLSDALNEIKAGKYIINPNKLNNEILNTYKKTIEFILYEEDSYKNYLNLKKNINFDFEEASNYFIKNVKPY